MKASVYLNEVLNLHSCVKYGNQISTIHSGFKYYEIDKTGLIEEECTNKNIVIFFTDGCFTVTCNSFTGRQFVQNEMVLVPKSSALKISGQQGFKLIFMIFDMPEESHDKFEIQHLADAKQAFSYDFAASPVHYPLTLFLDVVSYCLQNGMEHNANLHCMMHKEFFLLLKNFYTKQEVIAFLYPIIGKEPDFRDFIMQNYLKVNNVEELILLSNMGRSSFYTKFKDVFGVTAKQWMQKQISERILGKIMEPGICVKELMKTAGFDSHTHFYRYFKQQFGCTPKELIVRMQGRSNKY